MVRGPHPNPLPEGEGTRRALPRSVVPPSPAGKGDRGLGLSSLVARPSTVEQVATVLREASERGIAVYPVGGPPHPDRPGLVLDLAHLDQVHELSADDTLAVVGGGLTVARLAEAAAGVGLDYPPALTAPTGTTVGGALARGGLRSPGWGPDREQALGLRVALADGRLVDVGSRAIKNQTGYGLTQLVLGGRGALGVIVQATLRLWPRLPARRTLLAHFPTAADAARAAVESATSPLPPAAIELLDAAALDALSDAEGAFAGLARRDRRHPAALLAHVAGVDAAEVGERALEIASRLSATGGATVALLDGDRADAAWAAVRALPSRLTARWSAAAALEVGLPLDRVAAYTADAARRAGEAGVTVALSGPAGLGALSLCLLDSAPARRLELARVLFAEARAEGGQPLDAVGLGLEYDEWLSLVLPSPSAAALRRVRAALDPRGILLPART